MFIQYKEDHDIRNILYIQGMTEDEKNKKFIGESYYSKFCENKGLGNLPLTLKGWWTMGFLIKESLDSEFLINSVVWHWFYHVM